MSQKRFIDAMRDSMYSSYLGDKGPKNRVESILAGLRVIVPVVARFGIIGGLAYLAYSAWENRMVLICAALAILWVSRHNLRFYSFTSLLGSARFMTIEEMRAKGYFGGRGLILGRAREMKPGKLSALAGLVAKPLDDSEGCVRGVLDAMTGGRTNLTRIRDQPLVRLPRLVHGMLISPPRSGKGVSYLVPALMTWESACVTGDPKDGELYGITGEIRRSMGQEVIRLDPFNVHGPGGHQLNILEYFDKSDPMLVANCRQLADTLIPKDTNARDPHFPLNAYGLLSAILMYVVCHAPPASKNMNLVRYLLSDIDLLKGHTGANGEFIKGAFAHMRESGLLGGILSEAGSRYAGIPEKEFGSIVSTANTAIEFLADPLVAEHISRTSFDLKATTRNTTVYLILPATLMSAYANLMKMWLSCFLLTKRSQGLGEEDEVLFLLDEIGNLGELRVLEGAIHDGAGYGIRVFMALQSIKQVEANFPAPRCDSILAGCDLKIFMKVNDLATAKIGCEMLGKGTVTVSSRSTGRNHTGGGLHGAASFGSNHGRTDAPQARDLQTPDEFMRSDASYVFIKGEPPLLLSPIAYYQDRAFEQFNDKPLLQTPSIYSWVIALAALYFALPVAWDMMPPLPRWTASAPPSKTHHSGPTPDGTVAEVEARGSSSDRASRHVTPAAAPPAPHVPHVPRWPSVALCPRCKARYDLGGYQGQLIECQDCHATFRVRKQ